MERLTDKKEADAQRKAYKKRLEQGYPRNIPEERFLRLAAYEDAELEPEDIISAKDMFKIAGALHELNAYKALGPLDHLRELVAEEKAGQLPPVKPGDVLYEADHEHGVIKHTIREVGWFAHSDAVDDAGKSWWDHWGPHDIDTAYKTREGAEAARKEAGRAL